MAKSVDAIPVFIDPGTYISTSGAKSQGPNTPNATDPVHRIAIKSTGANVRTTVTIVVTVRFDNSNVQLPYKYY